MSTLPTLLPEILLEILNHLPQHSIYSLLQTCKSLHPICHRYLWSAVILRTSRRDGYPWYPNRGIDPDKDTFKKFLHLIQSGSPALGFEHTRVLWLGAPVFAKSLRPVTVGLRRYLERLFESGGLKLREVMVYFSAASIFRSENPQKLRDKDCLIPLLALKKYSASKTPRELSIKIEATTIISFLTYFQSHLITHLELWVDFNTSDTRGQKGEFTFTDHYGPIQNNISEFTNLLSNLNNLEGLIWRANVHDSYHTLPRLNPEILKALDELQKVFLTLNRLQHLELGGYIFHPSFFLTPPSNLKTLTISKVMTQKWWSQFATCPFPNVVTLTIKGRADGHLAYVPPEDGGGSDIDPRYLLEDVACRGLVKVSIRSLGWYPSDLDICLIRRNPKLDDESLGELAALKVALVVKESSKELRIKAEQCRGILSNDIPRRFLDGQRTEEEEQDLDLRKEVAEEYSKLFAGGQDTAAAGEELRASHRAWMQFRVEPRKQLQRHLEACIEMVADQYAEEYGSPENADSQEFLNDCLKSLGNIERTRGWTLRKREYSATVYRCGMEMENKIRDQHKMMSEELAERHQAGEYPTVEEVVDEWSLKLVEGFEEDIKRTRPVYLYDDT